MDPDRKAASLRPSKLYIRHMLGCDVLNSPKFKIDMLHYSWEHSRVGMSAQCTPVAGQHARSVSWYIAMITAHYQAAEADLARRASDELITHSTSWLTDKPNRGVVFLQPVISALPAWRENSAYRWRYSCISRTCSANFLVAWTLANLRCPCTIAKLLGSLPNLSGTGTINTFAWLPLQHDCVAAKPLPLLVPCMDMNKHGKGKADDKGWLAIACGLMHEIS